MVIMLIMLPEIALVVMINAKFAIMQLIVQDVQLDTIYSLRHLVQINVLISAH